MISVRLRKLLIWLAGAVGLYAVIGFFAVPALVKRQAVEHVERELGHKLELGDIRFNPFTLAAEIESLTLSEASGAKLLSFKRLFVNFQTESLVRRIWTFAAVELDAPDIRFELRPGGQHNFSALLDKLKQPSPEPEAPMPRLEIASIRVNDGRVDLADLPAGNDARLSLQPLTFELTELSTLPSETSAYKLTARTSDGETIEWSGDITLNPTASAGKLSLQKWKLSTLDRLLGNRVRLQSVAGQIDISLDYRAAFAQGQPSITVSGAELTLADLSLVATQGAAPLVGASKLSVTGGQFDLAQRTIGFARIGVEGGTITLVIADDGNPNWMALLPKSVIESAPEAHSPKTGALPAAEPASPASKNAPWQLKLGRFEANELAFSFSDRRAPSATAVSFERGRLGLGVEMAFGPEGVSGAISDFALTFGTLAANRGGEKLGMKSLGMNVSALALDRVTEQVRIGVQGLKLDLSGVSGAAGKQSVRADAVAVVARDADIAMDPTMTMIAALTVNEPTLEAEGLDLNADSAHALVDLKSLVLGAKQLRAALGQKTEIAADAIRTALTALVVHESEGKAIAARLGKLEATGGSASSSKRSVVFDRIVLADGYASASYSADGRLNWDRFVARFAPSSTAPPSPPGVAKPLPSGPAWNIAAKLVEADNFGAAYADARQQPNLAVAVYDVKARLRNVATAGNGRTDVDLTGRIKDSGQFRLAGTVNPTPLAADLKVNLDGISLLPVQPFLAQYARLKVVSGLASAQGRLRYGLPKSAGAQIVYEGELGLDKLDIQESDPVQPFLALGSMRASQVKLAVGPNGLDIPDLRLNRLVTKLLIAEDQSVNLLKVLRTQPGESATAPVPAGESIAKPNAPAAEVLTDPFPVSIGRIRFDHSELEFADLGLRPQLFSTRMHELQGVITGVSTSTDSRARLELDARVDEFGAATIRGSINPFRPRAFTEVDLDFRNIAMSSLSPYSSKFAGYHIASGQLTMNLQYRVKNSGLQGHNRIILDNLQLGERVESPSALNLPLEFAIAILKDSNGRIDVGLPVTGSLDDPQFSIAGLVWKAIGNLLTNIVTAPFRALASLFGGGPNEQLGAVEFDPGSAALRPPERQKLRTVAEALQKRPQLKLTIKPTYNVAADREVMKSLAMRRAVLARAGIKLEPGESPGPLDVGNPRMQQAIDALFVERYGLPAARDLRASLTTPAAGDGARKPSPEAPPAAQASSASRQASRIARSMSNQLMESTEVPDAELAELGQRRAAAISSELQNSAKIDAVRLSSEPPKASEGKNGQVVSELELSIAK